MSLDVATVLHATGARVARWVGGDEPVWGELSVADLQRPIRSVRIDSRMVDPEDLFVALPGERVDGHDFVAQAARRGARGALVSRLPDRPPVPLETDGRGFYAFVVPDTLRALHALASAWRAAHEVDVIGITGSVGKTTTKEIVASVLSGTRPVLKSEGNLNTEIGLPLVLMALRPDHRAAVLEMGMYLPGDIALLARIARPRVGIVTTVAPVHLERVGSIERIARAKSELVAALPADGLAVLNGDNRWTRAMATVSGIARSVLVGTAEDCQFRAADVVPLGLEGTRFVLEAEDRRMPVRVRVPGAHLVGAFLAAAATARFLDIAWDEIIPAIEQVALAERQSIVQGPDGVLIIDDSYNAAPMSMAAALDLLEASPGAKIAVLGDMLELGSEEEAAHQQVGERAARVADWLVVRGPRSAWIAEGAERSGLPAGRVLRTETNREAVEIVREIVRGRVAAESTRPSSTDDETPHLPSPRWAVLVKGSRGMRMEEVVQGLTERDR